MSDVPQYVVGSLGERCISKGRPMAICDMLRGNRYPHSRHKVLLCPHRRTDGVIGAACPRKRPQDWQEACMIMESQVALPLACVTRMFLDLPLITKN
jgi:hypothetical protein